MEMSIYSTPGLMENVQDTQIRTIEKTWKKHRKTQTSTWWHPKVRDHLQLCRWVHRVFSERNRPKQRGPRWAKYLSFRWRNEDLSNRSWISWSIRIYPSNLQCFEGLPAWRLLWVHPHFGVSQKAKVRLSRRLSTSCGCGTNGGIPKRSSNIMIMMTMINQLNHAFWGGPNVWDNPNGSYRSHEHLLAVSSCYCHQLILMFIDAHTTWWCSRVPR